MKEDLVEKLAAVIREADIYDSFEETARAVLAAIEADGKVIVERGPTKEVEEPQICVNQDGSAWMMTASGWAPVR